MTEQEWLTKAKENKNKLIDFLESWHPRAKGKIRSHEYKITASASS